MVRFVEDEPSESAPVDAGSEALAPIIPLFGSAGSRTSERRGSGSRTPEARESVRRREGADAREAASSRGRHPAGSARLGRGGRAFGAGDGDADGRRDDERASRKADPERTLLRKLAVRSLSVVEARAVLAAEGADEAERDRILEVFLDRGYLDDAALAEQLVHSGLERKAQGRRAIALTLTKRGVPRDIAEQALRDAPDDDADRAREFAETKARSLRGLAPEVALRRLVGQLARRGFPSGVAMSAAREALSADR